MPHRATSPSAAQPTTTAAAVPPPATRIVVVHGLGATARSHWFGALRERYAPRGLDVVVADLPTSEAPVLDEWLTTLAEAVGPVDETTVLVGHSLGCVTLLQHLAAREDDWSLGGLALVAGFAEPVPGLPVTEPFVARALDPAALAARTARRHVLAADDDPVVPRRLTEDLARALDADLTVVEGAGHFLARDGWDRLAALEDVLDAWTRGVPAPAVS
jgi:uncharacterized protein